MTLTGLYVPLITPFAADGAVALDTLEALAHRVLDDGATGIVALGTTAEPGSLTDAEQRSVVDVAALVCRERRAPLLVGASTVPALELLRDRPEVVAALMSCHHSPGRRRGVRRISAISPRTVRCRSSSITSPTARGSPCRPTRCGGSPTCRVSSA